MRPGHVTSPSDGFEEQELAATAPGPKGRQRLGATCGASLLVGITLTLAGYGRRRSTGEAPGGDIRSSLSCLARGTASVPEPLAALGLPS